MSNLTTHHLSNQLSYFNQQKNQFNYFGVHLYILVMNRIRFVYLFSKFEFLPAHPSVRTSIPCDEFISSHQVFIKSLRAPICLAVCGLHLIQSTCGFSWN
jgi:hypothetical protein